MPLAHAPRYGLVPELKAKFVAGKPYSSFAVFDFRNGCTLFEGLKLNEALEHVVTWNAHEVGLVLHLGDE